MMLRCDCGLARLGSGGMEPVSGVENMPSVDHDPASRDRLTATWVELTIRLGVLGLLLYSSFTLVRVCRRGAGRLTRPVGAVRQEQKCPASQPSLEPIRTSQSPIITWIRLAVSPSIQLFGRRSCFW
jgi:hypothetical protein